MSSIVRSRETATSVEPPLTSGQLYFLGITGAVGGRPKPTPCLKLFSFLHPKQQMDASIHLNDQTANYSAPIFEESTEEVEAENKVVKEVCLPTGSNSYR